MRFARSPFTAVVLGLSASLASCSPPASISPSAAISSPPSVTTTATAIAPPVEMPPVTPWLTMRAEHPVALLDALDQARGEAPGTLAHWLFGASPSAPEEPIRGWVVGEADAPALWLSWARAPASPRSGAVLSCDAASSVCATNREDLARAAAFTGAQATDSKAAVPTAEPAIAATIPKAAFDWLVPKLVARAAGALARMAEGRAAVKNIDPATVEPLLSMLGNRYRVENFAHKALTDIEQAEIRLGAVQGGFRLDVASEYKESGSSPMSTRLGASTPDDGVSAVTLARRCPADSHMVWAIRQSPEDGTPLVPLALVFQVFARALRNDQLTKALRSTWDATSMSSVTCQTWGPDGKTISYSILALRDPKAASRALAQVTTVRVKSDKLKVDVQRVGKTVTLDVLRGTEAQSMAMGVVDDSLVMILTLSDKAGKRLDAMRTTRPLSEAPLVHGLDSAPLLFGLDLSKAMRVPGTATLRARLELPAPGKLRATVLASAGMIAFLNDLTPSLDTGR